MQLTSTAFTDSTKIPSLYTGDGSNFNPPLEWSEVPANTKTFGLIMEDPDVPRNLRPDGLFIHWIVWNIPSSMDGVVENSGLVGVAGLGTGGQLGYTGPRPPNGSHRYYFRLYALDCELTLPSTATKGELLMAMQGHILAQAELMGRYERTIN